MQATRIVLEPSEIPTHRYNVVADLAPPPAPLCRALRLERALGTPAKIFYRNEGVSPAGAHKPNAAVPQACYQHAAGSRRLTAGTGAGQWGSARAFAGQLPRV